MQRAAELADTVESTLVSRMNTRPLLPSQKRRFREVQLPDGKYIRACQKVNSPLMLFIDTSVLGGFMKQICIFCFRDLVKISMR